MNVTFVKNKQEKYIKKHNAAIRSYSEMSLLEKKIANVLLYNAYHNLKTNNIHTITISQLLDLLLLKTNDYKKLKQAIKQLMSTIIEWNVNKKENFISCQEKGKKLFDSRENWKACTLLSSVQIDGTIIRYEYSEILRELFYQPSFYSKISLCVQSKFRSAYSISLYENCLSYINCGTTGWLDIGVFRKMMGVKPSQYQIFRDFNRRVLQPAVKEVNKVSSIEVNYEIKKTRRIVSGIKLYINHKKQYTEKNITDIKSNVIDGLIAYGVSKNQCELWVAKYGENYIKEKLGIIKNYPVAIKSTVALLSKAIKEDWNSNTIKQSNIVNQQQQNQEKTDIPLEENKIWFNNLSNDEKIKFLNEVIFKFPMFEIHMEHQKVDLLDKHFVDNDLFNVFMQVLGKAIQH